MLRIRQGEKLYPKPLASAFRAAAKKTGSVESVSSSMDHFLFAARG
jgi:hypothetical protein